MLMTSRQLCHVAILPGTEAEAGTGAGGRIPASVRRGQ